MTKKKNFIQYKSKLSKNKINTIQIQIQIRNFTPYKPKPKLHTILKLMHIKTLLEQQRMQNWEQPYKLDAMNSLLKNWLGKISPVHKGCICASPAEPLEPSSVVFRHKHQEKVLQYEQYSRYARKTEEALLYQNRRASQQASHQLSSYPNQPICFHFLCHDEWCVLNAVLPMHKQRL